MKAAAIFPLAKIESGEEITRRVKPREQAA